jgi:hypothetical protein
LKSRATFQNLVDEEKALSSELSAYEDKFDAWIEEPSSKPDSDKPQ